MVTSHWVTRYGCIPGSAGVGLETGAKTRVQRKSGNKAAFRHSIAMFFHGFLYRREQTGKKMLPAERVQSMPGTRSKEEIVPNPETVNFLLRCADTPPRRPRLGHLVVGERRQPQMSIRKGACQTGFAAFPRRRATARTSSGPGSSSSQFTFRPKATLPIRPSMW